MTQIKQIKTDKISEDQFHLRHQRSIPKHWSWVKLGDVAKLIRGVSYRKEQASKSPKENYTPILRATNINSVLNFDDLIYVPVELIKEEQLVKEGDILVAMSSGSKDLVGKAAQSYFDTNVSFGTFCGLIRFSSNVNKRFFGYFFQSREYRNHISNISMGVNINNLRREHIEELAIPLPPLPEQKKIVEKIEELFSGLDNGVASLKEAKEQIRLYRQSVLASAFSGKLTQSAERQAHSGILKAAEPKVEYSNQLPDGWKWVKLGEITQINPKLPFEKIDDDMSVSFLPMKQVEELTGKFNLSLEKKYVEVKKGLTPFTNGDVIFAKITPCMENGKIAVMHNLKNEIGFGSTEFHVFRTKNELNNHYLFYFLIQESFRAKAQHNMTGAVGQKRVPRRFLEESEIPLPPLNQQTQIVEEIEKRFSEADNLEKAIDDSLAKAETLRQSILKKAFEGKLV